MILRIDVTEARAIEREFQQAEARFADQAFDVLIDYGRQLQSLTRQLAPEDKGTMKRLVKLEFFDDDSGFEVGWFSDDFAAAGEDPHYWYVEFGTSDTEAQPSLRPAWESLEPALGRELEALLGQVFQ